MCLDGRTHLLNGARFAAIFLLSCLTPTIVMSFAPPTDKQIKSAIGDVAGLPPTLQRAFAPDSNAFRPIPAPGPDDWLAVHAEPGQTFEQFRASQPNRPMPERNVIYLQPLGDFAPDRSPDIDKLQKFAAVFFAMEVKTLPTIPIDNSHFTTRRNTFTNKPQILTSDVLGFLKNQLPADAFCLLAITMEDLYPEPSWNFVFGQASLRERVGVYSFARYDPMFYDQPRGSDYQALLLRRSCKVLAHETGHMFGLDHCVYFNCLMNGSNHLAESDRRPLHLCPVCLRKLQSSIGFDVLKRYNGLAGIDRALGFTDEADWLDRRIKVISE